MKQNRKTENILKTQEKKTKYLQKCIPILFIKYDNVNRNNNSQSNASFFVFVIGSTAF